MYVDLNGMELEVDYSVDRCDSRIVEITKVKWRGVDVLCVLTDKEISELYAEIADNEYDKLICAAEDRADAARESAWGV